MCAQTPSALTASASSTLPPLHAVTTLSLPPPLTAFTPLPLSHLAVVAVHWFCV